MTRTLLFVLVLLVGCSPSSQEQLIANFEQNRDSLQSLARLMEIDTGVQIVSSSSMTVRLSDGRLVEDTKALTPERWDRYKELLGKVSAQSISRSDGGVLIYVATTGLGVSGSMLGYLHSSTPPVNLVENLDKHDHKGFAFRRLDNGWYLVKGNS